MVGSPVVPWIPTSKGNNNVRSLVLTYQVKNNNNVTATVATVVIQKACSIKLLIFDDKEEGKWI